METAAADTLKSLAVTTVRSIRQPVASLSGGQRQSVAIAKAVLWNSRLVIMDEPTAALGVAQTAMVLDLVRRLADRGLAVLLISHNLNDVFEVADRIAVLTLGQMVGRAPGSRVRPPDRRGPNDERPVEPAGRTTQADRGPESEADRWHRLDEPRPRRRPATTAGRSRRARQRREPPRGRLPS